MMTFEASSHNSCKRKKQRTNLWTNPYVFQTNAQRPLKPTVQVIKQKR